MLYKKIILIILAIIITTVSNDCYAEQQLDNLTETLVTIKSTNGDFAARKYIESRYNVNQTPQSVEDLLAVFYWCSLTNNLYTSTQDSNYASEYIHVFDLALRPIFDSDFNLSEFVAFVPEAYYNYAMIKFRGQKYKEAIEILTKIKSWFDKESTLKSEFKGYSIIVKDLGTILCRDLHDYNKAIPVLKESLKYLEKTSSNYLDACYSIALCYNKNGDHNNAVTYMEKVMTLYPNSDEFNQIYYNRIKQEYEMMVASKTGLTSDVNSAPIDGTRDLYQCLRLLIEERFEDALPSLLILKENAELEQPLNQETYVTICTSIINAYNGIADLDKAAKIFFELSDKIDFDKISDGSLVSILESSGMTNYLLDNYSSALSKFNQAYRIMDKNEVYGIELAKILSNISLCYFAQEDYLSAKWYNDEACERYEESGQSLYNGSASANMLINNRGLILLSLNYLHEAADLYEEILKNNVQTPDLSLVYMNLAVTYQKLGEWNKAVNLLENLSTDNQILQLAIDQNLAIAYSQLRDKKVRRPLSKMNSRAIDLFCQYFSVFTRTEWENYWDRQAKELIVTNNYVACRDSSLCDIAFNNLLVTKNLSLISSEFIKDAVSESNDVGIQKKYTDYLTLKESLTNANVPTDSVAKYRQSLKATERELVSSIPNLKTSLNKYFPTWEQIQQTLREDEAVVEFTYTPINVDWSHPESMIGHYGAYIITKNMTLPKQIALCEVDTLDQIVSNHDSDESSISAFYNDSTIYELLWEPLLPNLSDISTIYYAPTGSINSINLEAIIASDNQRLGDIYNLKRVSSSASIVNQEYESPSLAVLYGGINYDTDVTDMIAHSKGYIDTNPQSDLALRGELDRGNWNYLPGTLAEINEIETTIKRKYTVTKYSGDDANEESIKLLRISQPAILHIATHGFYLRNLTEVDNNSYISNLYSYNDKQTKLIRTGLLFAGANNVWTGRQEKIQGAEDGILTSAEISNLNLENVELLVLSACESGRGYIDAVDGVYGLQRAFKQAGVKTIVMSLWKIPDAPTAVLMEEFYKNIITGCNPNMALNIAKRELQQKGYTDPYYWASFVVLD